MSKSKRSPTRLARPITPSDKPIGLRDLAAHLGLSRSTVSLVLNNSPVAQGLKAETRERVLKAAAELNYKANYFARVLNKKRSHMIGILSPDLTEGYDSELLTAMEGLLIERNYVYFISSHHWNRDLVHQLLQIFAERGAEGVILINTPVDAPPNIPLVSIGSLAHEFPVTRIVIDNAVGVHKALDYLYSLGHREIAFFKGHAGSSDTEARWAAYQEGCRKLGLPVDERLIVQLERIRDGLDPISEGYQAAGKLLKSGQPFTALMAFNDMSAVGAIHALRDAGKRVPEDVSVVGFDDVQAATIVQPPLTTIRQPLERMGVLATTEMLARIEDPLHAVTEFLIEPELVVRKSCAACPQPEPVAVG